MADAIAEIESLADEFKLHVAKQEETNVSIRNDIVELQKQRIADIGDMKLILQTVNTIHERIKDSKTMWQIWGPAIISAFISVSGVIVAIIAIGAK